ncbi:hypothetical protein EVAR_44055_1 [Eumeta japonica]|uniref:Uncharacterized protein n=1 Tax=Eumeta variegata TaxID=151549 RepID=A0A4C1XJ33_EUMVA|nr:hypothetical protein EVAR_44055_1 [Eumeta japonica]
MEWGLLAAEYREERGSGPPKFSLIRRSAITEPANEISGSPFYFPLHQLNYSLLQHRYSPSNKCPILTQKAGYALGFRVSMGSSRLVALLENAT